MCLITFLKCIKIIVFLSTVEEQELLNRYESNPQKRIETLSKLLSEQKQEQKNFDETLVMQLDQKVWKLMYLMFVSGKHIYIYFAGSRSTANFGTSGSTRILCNIKSFGN